MRIRMVIRERRRQLISAIGVVAIVGALIGALVILNIVVETPPAPTVAECVAAHPEWSAGNRAPGYAEWWCKEQIRIGA